LPDPDTPTTATVRHNGTSTSISRKLLWRAPRTPMTVGKLARTSTCSSGLLRICTRGRRYLLGLINRNVEKLLSRLE
jgi:hypothetical protein